jgi:peptide deformylase
MAETLSIIELGHPVLRQMAEPVQTPDAPHIQTLIENLIQTLQASNGVGIAAPQVEQSYQLLVIASHPNPRYPDAPEMEPLPLINPTLIAHSSEQVKGWEGCLSIPGFRARVPRFQSVEVEFCDRTGKLQRRVFTDFVARIFQHEFDHLIGQMFVDRIESTLDLVTEAEFQKRFPATQP